MPSKSELLISPWLLLLSLFIIYLFFACCFSAFCFSAPNQNVSHGILNALGGFGSCIRSLRVFSQFKVYIHEVYLNCIVCIFNRIDLYKLYIIYIWLWKRIPYIYNPNVQKKCLILHYFLTSDDTSFFLTKLLINRN